MSKTISSCCRVVFIVLTSFLFLGFLTSAIGGIVMKSSKTILQESLSQLFGEYDGDDEGLGELMAFLLKIVDRMATYEIVISAVLAVFCLISLTASCCGWNNLLKACTGILIILLIAQIITVAVVYSNPTKYANGVVTSTEALLKSYRGEGVEGNKSTRIWNVLMEAVPQCCGMDGYKDFVRLGNDLPLPCCNTTTGICDAAAAQIAGVTGCRSKLELISAVRSVVLLYFFIAIILLQTMFVALLLLYNCVIKSGEGKEG
ncbi:Tetraspanin-16 [Taenia solium]|eukprot:TsM_000184200 transcript=TsM_000184200 gene=TsM_000184200